MEDPKKKAFSLISDTHHYAYDGAPENLEDAKNDVLSDISEILRNCVDHKEPEKVAFFEKVKIEVENYGKV